MLLNLVPGDGDSPCAGVGIPLGKGTGDVPPGRVYILRLQCWHRVAQSRSQFFYGIFRLWLANGLV